MRSACGLWAFIAVIAVFSLSAFANGPEDPSITPLLTSTGQENTRIPVGELRIWNDDKQLHVQYKITNADWRLTSTHLKILNNAEKVHQRQSFLHSNRYEREKIHAGVLEFTHKIPINWVAPRDLLIDADAEVMPVTGYTSDVMGFTDSLPPTVSLSVVHPSPDLMAYSQAVIADGGFLDGFHYSWCVDLDRKIEQNVWYTADVYSIFEELPKNFLECPENLDLVNWILNENFVGKPSPYLNYYTYGDVQRLIWDLLDNENTPFGLEPWDRKRVEEIREKALAHGEGFIPGCGQRSMVILVPVDEIQEIIAQPIAIAVPVPCIPAVHKATVSVQTVYTTQKKWGVFFASPIRIPAFS